MRRDQILVTGGDCVIHPYNNTFCFDNVRIICIDLAGHGHSGNRSSGTYHAIDYAADVVFLVDKLKIQRFSVLGM